MTGQLKQGAVRLTGLDEAIAGVSDSGVFIYDFEKVIEELCTQDMTAEDAMEWFDFNIAPLAGQGEGFVILYEFNGEWEVEDQS